MHREGFFHSPVFVYNEIFGMPACVDIVNFLSCESLTSAAKKKYFSQLRQYHHGKKHHTAHGIDAVYDKADFHQRILRFTPEIGKDGEKAAENHKDAIAGDHDLRSR